MAAAQWSPCGPSSCGGPGGGPGGGCDSDPSRPSGGRVVGLSCRSRRSAWVFDLGHTQCLDARLYVVYDWLQRNAQFVATCTDQTTVVS